MTVCHDDLRPKAPAHPHDVCNDHKLIVARIGRTGGRRKPLGRYVVEWRMMRVCWADRHESRAKERRTTSLMSHWTVNNT